MPVHILASTVSAAIPTEYWASLAAACISISMLKTWSRGPSLLEPPTTSDSFTDLHGRIILIASGAFTPLGVVTLSSLAHRGAQLIALTPDISAPEVLQMIHLIRDSTQSEPVYAEQCDLGDLESISAFAALWNAGDKGQKEGVRRLDGLLFLPPGREELQRVRLAESTKGRREEVYQLHVLARFHLVNSLLSSLLVQPRDREVRLVSVMSPFYAAGLGHFDLLATQTATTKGKGPKGQLQTLSETSFSALLGAASLRWYALTLELQRRLDLLAEADPRPRTKLAGIDPESTSSTTFTHSGDIKDEAQRQMRQHSNISIVNVCPGFERTDLIDTFFPRSSSSSFIARIRGFLRWMVLLLLWPVVWLLAKSPATAANSVVWGTTRKLEPLSMRYARILESLSPPQGKGKERETRGWQDPVIPAEMYREGRIVRPQLPVRFGKRGEKQDAWAELWKGEEMEVERRIKALGGSIKRPKV
ncbi:NAD(P)-binding domain protein [Kalmanozyma brasiliensis GHG001]|uniref:Ketoreductase (KR) domain-containing protein n=1 Tax=Kalmanozyma brasiliensis (strain GHG001) TaxID=1365824 RepID=V5GGJ4_KALBG|nr:NAD(P)-binding domain protein [Kalmanozyma brasiliensis GHG001]EST05107.1 NAD(P)-binding domain protein [Kalmanozyma brasiliensis GHG001]